MSDLSAEALAAMERLTLRVNGIHVNPPLHRTPDPGYNTVYNPVTGLETAARNHRRRNTIANRRNGGSYPGVWKPDADYLLGVPVTQPTETPAWDGHVTPAGGRRVNGDEGAARAESVNAGYREWVTARTNTVTSAGDAYPAMWPDGSQPYSY